MTEEIELVFVETGQGYAVPLSVIKARDQKQVEINKKNILFLPALGVVAKFYRPLALALSYKGYNVVLFEQRGYGRSSLRASRSIDYGFQEWLNEDIPASIEWIKQNLGKDIILMGHSLGGHLASCYVGLHPKQISRIILCATGTPWRGAFQGMMKIKIIMLSLLVPLMVHFWGYYNGKRLGGKRNRCRF